MRKLQKMFSITVRHEEQLQWLCEQYGLTRSDVIRRLIEDRYAKEQEASDDG